MTRKEAERITRQENTLMSLGFTQDEAEALRRISITLHRWHELECGDGNGCIERDEKTGKPRYFNARSRYVDPHDPRAWRTIPDREKGALKRLDDIIAAHNGRGRESGPHTITRNPQVSAYIQTDPRGAALYIIRPDDIPEGEKVVSYYNRGVCVY